MSISGKVRQAKQQTENLIITRSIRCEMGINRIIIEDEIINEDVRPSPFMLLYHRNFGYPLVNPDCEIIIPSKTVEGWDEFSQKALSQHTQMTEPQIDAKHYTYLYRVRSDDDGCASFLIADRSEHQKWECIFGILKKHCICLDNGSILPARTMFWRLNHVTTILGELLMRKKMGHCNICNMEKLYRSK